MNKYENRGVPETTSAAGATSGSGSDEDGVFSAALSDFSAFTFLDKSLSATSSHSSAQINSE